MFRRRISQPSAPAIALAAVMLLLVVSVPASAQGRPDQLPGAGPVVLEGELEVVFEDHEDRGRLFYFLRSDNRRIPLRFQNDDGPELPTGARVRVHGNLNDGTVSSASVTTLAVSASRTLGNQFALVILFNFSNNPTQAFSPATIASVNEAVTNFYLENTYGQTLFSFTVTNWLTISASDATCDYSTWASQAEAAAANAGYNPNAYDRRIFAFPRVAACAWSGMGNLGGPRSWLNGSYSVRTVAHEQGHNFGNYHSHRVACDASSCTSSDYGDDRDVLGVPGTVGHLNAFQKERLGYLNYGASPIIQTVTANGDYWIDNYEGVRGATKALKVWDAVKGQHYYIESRAQTGYDASVAPGVTLHTGSPNSANSSNQVDLDPSTAAYDSTLDVGQVFTDAALGLVVETLSSTLDGAMIRISFAAQPPATCTRVAPTVWMSPTSQSAAAGSATSYSVNVRNNNSTACAASAFSVSAGVPGGWSVAMSGSGLNALAAGATTTATLVVTAPTGTVPGAYAFPVNVSESTAANTASATASLNVVDANLGVSASATIGSGKGAKALAISVTVQSGGAPVSGAAVAATIVMPNGSSAVLNGTTGADGRVALSHSVKPKDPRGTYGVTVSASKSGASGTASTSIVVP